MGTSTYKSSRKRLMHACLAANMWKMTHSMLDYIYCTSLILSTGLFKFEQDEPKKTLLLSILQMVLSFLLCLSLSNCKEWQQCKTAPTYCKYTKTPQGLRRTKPHTDKHTRTVCPWALMDGNTNIAVQSSLLLSSWLNSIHHPEFIHNLHISCHNRDASYNPNMGQM